jgi:translation initiation factor 1
MMGLFAGTKWDVPAHCDRCGALESECKCPPKPAPEPVWLAAEKQTARLAIEKRNRGSVVTLVRGLVPSETNLKELLSQLRSACGAGGTLKDDAIEIQGRHLDRVREYLAGLGYKTKG